MPPCCFHQVEVHHLYRPKNRNNSLIRDQKSNKHIANGYKKLVCVFKREDVQFSVATKNLAVNHLSLEALPAVQTWTANCERHRKAVFRWHFAVAVCSFHEKPDAKVSTHIFSVGQPISYFTVTSVSRQVLLFAFVIFYFRSATNAFNIAYAIVFFNTIVIGSWKTSGNLAVALLHVWFTVIWWCSKPSCSMC